VSKDPVLKDPGPPSWRTQVENALYSEAKWPPDQVNYFMDQLRKEHAHELAEQIRARNNEVYGISGPLFGPEVADLIDPEVPGGD
jgi:hypothetical protein